MMHPSTELRYIDQAIGFGVFATTAIPEGTIVFVQDILDISISDRMYQTLDVELKKNVDHYAFIDQDGNRVLCWDHAKYVNHCCHPNTISTGYGFEIAVRDIAKDEQITDDYGLFNLSYETVFTCNINDCRKNILRDDFDRLYAEWDKQITQSLRYLDKVPQRLLPYISNDIREQLEAYLSGKSAYRSVRHLQLKNTEVKL